MSRVAGDSLPWAHSLASGLAGWAALVLSHEIGRRVSPDAPRLDVLNRRAVAHGVSALLGEPPPHQILAPLTVSIHLAVHTLLYSVVGLGKNGRLPWVAGPLAGLAAGLGAALLPSPLGLGTGPTMRTRATQGMSVAWHLIGGLAAAGAYKLLERFRIFS